MRRRILWFALLFTISSSAVAQKAKLRCPKITNDAQTETVAGQLFAAGEKAFKKKRYKRALNRFMCSLQLTAHINTVFNIAQVVPLVRNKRVSLMWLHKYVDKHDDNWTTRELKKVIIKLEKIMKRKPSWDPDTLLHEQTPADT